MTISENQIEEQFVEEVTERVISRLMKMISNDPKFAACWYARLSEEYSKSAGQ